MDSWKGGVFFPFSFSFFLGFPRFSSSENVFVSKRETYGDVPAYTLCRAKLGRFRLDGFRPTVFMRASRL